MSLSLRVVLPCGMRRLSTYGERPRMQVDRPATVVRAPPVLRPILIIIVTRLLSNLSPTTRECVHLVTCAQFRLRGKDGSHTIRSAISKNPMLHAYFIVLCFIVPELMPIEVLHCGNGNFGPYLLLLP